MNVARDPDVTFGSTRLRVLQVDMISVNPVQPKVAFGSTRLRVLQELIYPVLIALCQKG